MSKVYQGSKLFKIKCMYRSFVIHVICIDGQWVTPSDPVYHWQTSTQLSSNSMDKLEKMEDGRVYSILPAENYNLIHTRWEDDIIWDPDVSTCSNSIL